VATSVVVGSGGRDFLVGNPAGLAAVGWLGPSLQQPNRRRCARGARLTLLPGGDNAFEGLTAAMGFAATAATEIFGCVQRSIKYSR